MMATIHERLQQRTLSQQDYEQYLSDYRRRDYTRNAWIILPDEHVDFDDMHLNSHAFGIRDHVRSLHRDPEWVHYTPVSEAYWNYYGNRLGDMGGDYEEMRVETIAEYYKSLYWD